MNQKNEKKLECIYCQTEIEKDDNFCPKCGNITSQGYIYLKNKKNFKKIMNGEAIKQDKKLLLLVSILNIGLLIFFVMLVLRGEELFKPIIYIKKQISTNIYGYNKSTIKTTNKYNNINIQSYEEAIKIIKKDFDEQIWLCQSNNQIFQIENKIEQQYDIPSVNFCDISYEEVKKIYEVINKIYSMFPTIKGALTNITIGNTKSNYIAYFQPMYQFVNINKNINNYNKVNKTQILLNSYYFLNTTTLNTKIEQIAGDNYYVKDATFESLIAHELGHYISFVILLKENNMENITFESKYNQEKIKRIINIFNEGTHSKQIIDEALNNYNKKYNANYNQISFALTISNYAARTDENGNLIADETIAEALHDYYLHEENMKNASKEIINIIKNKLGEL